MFSRVYVKSCGNSFLAFLIFQRDLAFDVENPAQFVNSHHDQPDRDKMQNRHARVVNQKQRNDCRQQCQIHKKIFS